MARTIKARFSKGVIEPLEKVEVEEGKEITVTLEPEKGEEVKETVRISIYSVKVETFLKHAGLVSIGGDAVKEARQYDE